VESDTGRQVAAQLMIGTVTGSAVAPFRWLIAHEIFPIQSSYTNVGTFQWLSGRTYSISRPYNTGMGTYTAVYRVVMKA
jgi:hypothetical protein